MQFFLLCSATATFMINELVNNYEENKAIVDNLNIHFLPMANPDGYEYSRNSDRMWRKNRNRDNKASGGTHWLYLMILFIHFYPPKKPLGRSQRHFKNKVH